MSDRPAPIFAWLTGQHDNIGDSLLRRPYAASLATAGELHVWAGDPRAGYVSGLELGPEVSVAPTFLRWYGELVRSVITGRTHFAFNAGEFLPTKGYVAGVVALLPWLVVLKARRGSVMWVGAGVRSTRAGFTWPFRALLRMADLVRWRDSRSSQLLAPAAVMPDWAFGLGPSTSTDPGPQEELSPRDLLVVSLRGDRSPPSDEWCRAVRDLAGRLDLRIAVVAQVQRDHARAGRLAEALEGERIGWAHDSHHEQEQVVRRVYQRSRAVVSDRLHALIVGATEGAVPLGWCEHATEKLDRHFAVVDLDWVYRPGQRAVESLDQLTDERLRDYEGQLADAVARARDRVKVEIGAITALIADEPRAA